MMIEKRYDRAMANSAQFETDVANASLNLYYLEDAIARTMPEDQTEEEIWRLLTERDYIDNNGTPSDWVKKKGYMIERETKVALPKKYAAYDGEHVTIKTTYVTHSGMFWLHEILNERAGTVAF